MRRRGFTLLSVLWVVVTLSVLISGINSFVRRSFLTMAIIRARTEGRWQAEGCFAEVQAIANAMMEANPHDVGAIWGALDHRILDNASSIHGCTWSTRTDGRVVLGRATPQELIVLPGMTAEAVDRILWLRSQNIPIHDPLSIHSGLSQAARTVFESHYPEFIRRVTLEPDVWCVRMQVHIPLAERSGQAGREDVATLPVNIEARFIRSENRIAIVRWVEW